VPGLSAPGERQILYQYCTAASRGNHQEQSIIFPGRMESIAHNFRGTYLYCRHGDTASFDHLKKAMQPDKGALHVRSENNQRHKDRNAIVENNSMWPLLHHGRAKLGTVHSHVHHHSHTSQRLSRPWAIAIRCCCGLMPKEPRVYFAVRVGRKPGIYTTWLHSTPLLLNATSLTLLCEQGRLPRASVPLSSCGFQEDEVPRRSRGLGKGGLRRQLA
jgi:hypothetical protein